MDQDLLPYYTLMEAYGLYDAFITKFGFTRTEFKAGIWEVQYSIEPDEGFGA